MKKYNKLIRDNIPEIILSDNCIPKVRKLSHKDFKLELLRKLLEEAGEVSKAENKKELISELADVQEVMISIYEAYGIECGDVTKEARIKRKNKGGFKKKLFLESIK
jgi:predicted house-cleaning noncanonical NTP pyrophosphatase (MazG superfamily)